MKLNREDVKKLVINEMLQEGLKTEDLASWFRNLGNAARTKSNKTGSTDSQVDEQTLEKLGEFLQLAQPDPEISKLILQTPLGKKVFYSTSNKEQSLEESLYGDYVKMMKKAGVNQQMVTGFIEVMKTNKKALALLKQVGIDVSEKSDTQSAAGVSKPPDGASQQTQTGQAQTSTVQTQQQDKTAAAQSTSQPQTSPASPQITKQEAEEVGKLIDYDKLVNTMFRGNLDLRLDSNIEGIDQELEKLDRASFKTPDTKAQQDTLQKKLKNLDSFKAGFQNHINKVLPKKITDLPFVKEQIEKSLISVLKEKNIKLNLNTRNIITEQIYDVLTTGKTK